MQTSLRQRMIARAAPPPRHRAGTAMPVYQIALQFDVGSTLQLWHAAAQRLRESGLSTPDIETTIGLASDPSIADCLATLILPRHAPGCDLIDVRIGQGCVLDDLFASPLPNASEH